MINERKLAFKYLCMKKSRSLATLFAIIVSVFLVFVCSNLAVSAFYAEREEEIQRDGNYIAYLDGVKAEDIPKLEKDGAMVCALRNSKYDLGNLGSDNDSTTFGLYYFEDFLEFPYSYEVTQGTVPDEAGEIMLHEDWKSELGENVKPGDSITLNIEMSIEQDGVVSEEKVTKTYTLAGFYDCPENSWLEENNILVKDEPRNLESTYRVYITSQEGGVEELEGEEEFAEVESWARNLGAFYNAKVTLNPMFKEAYGAKTMLMYCLILLAGALIGSFAVVVIRNAFVLSIVERTRDYGMLRCIGASQRQVRKIAFYEASFLGIAGVGIGLLISYLFLCLGVAIGKRYFSLTECFRVTHHPVLILGTCFIVLVVVIFSLLEPTRQINRLSPLNALRNRKEIKKEHFRAGGTTSRLIGKLFGVEGQYAYKNLLRNRKKFITMTGSGIISIALFVGANSFFTYSTEDSAYYNADIHFDEEYLYSDSDINFETDISSVEKELNEMKGISNLTVTYGGFYLTDQETLSWKSGEAVTGVNILSIKEENIEKESIVDEYQENSDAIGCYIVNWEYDAETGNWTEQFDIKLGDSIKLHNYFEWGKDAKEENISQIEVTAILKEHPIKNYIGTYGNIILMPEAAYKELCLEQGISQESYMSSVEIFLKIEEDCDVSEVKKLLKNHGMALEDTMEGQRKSAEQVKMARLIVNVILILVSLISAMNIFNNMQSNLVLREKERSIMRAIGMSLRQYRKMTFLEGILSTIFALIFGTILGLGFGYGIYRIVLISSTELKFAVPVGSIVLSGVGLMLLTMLSSLGGMKKEAYGVPSKV